MSHTTYTSFYTSSEPRRCDVECPAHARAYRKAVADEREECAKVLDDVAQEDPGMANHCRMLARRIRERETV